MKKIIFLLIVLFAQPLNIVQSDILGDINNDGKIDTKEAIHALQVSTGIQPSLLIDSINNNINGNISISGDIIPVSGKLRVLGDFSVGKFDEPNKTGYGNKLFFEGIDYNTDRLWIARYNVESDITELRVNIGDDIHDKFVVGFVDYHKPEIWQPKLSVQMNGKVGIGTNEPSATLHIKTKDVLNIIPDDAADDLVIENGGTTGLSVLSTNNGNGIIRFGDTEDNSAGGITYQHTEDKMLLRVNAETKASIDSNGHLGVGTKTPEEKLDVKGNIKLSGNLMSDQGNIISVSDSGDICIGKCE